MHLIRHKSLWKSVDFTSSSKFAIRSNIISFLNTFCGAQTKSIWLKFTDKGIINTISRKCPNLKRLKLRVSEDSLVNFPSNLNLECVELECYGASHFQQSRRRKGTHFTARRPLTALKRLALDGFLISQSFCTDIKHTIISDTETSIRELCLHKCKISDLESFISITTGHPHLTSLSLSVWYEELPEELWKDILKHIATHFTGLAKLSIDLQHRPPTSVHTDEFLELLSRRTCPAITHLRISGSAIHYTPQNFQLMTMALQNIEELELSNLKDELMRIIATFLQQLKVLIAILPGGSLSDGGLGYLKNHSSLETLDVRFCLGLTVQGIIDIIGTMPKLRSVRITDGRWDPDEGPSEVKLLLQRRFPRLVVSVDYL